MDLSRYKRQSIFEEIGMEGQKKLLNSKVCIIGCGALGTVLAEEIVRAGIGETKLIDRDYVEISNLQRQFVFTEEDAKNAVPKAEALYDHLHKANSDVQITPKILDITAKNIESEIKGYDIVLDGTDSFEIRYLINEACVKNKIPWIYGGAIGAGGAVMPIFPEGPCFKCFMPEMLPPGSYDTCTTVGVISPITAIIASYEVSIAIKYLIDKRELIDNKYIAIDLFSNVFEEIEIEKNEDCEVCVKRNFELLDNPALLPPASLCGHNAFQITPNLSKIDINTLSERLQKIGKVNQTKFSLSFTNEDASFKVFPDGRAIIDNVKTENEARKIYTEYIGV